MTVRLNNFRGIAVIAAALLIAAVLLLGLAQDARGQTPVENPNGVMTKEEIERSLASAPDVQEERRVDEDPDGNPYIAGELIVTYEENVAASSEVAVAQEVDANTLGTFPEIDARHLSLPNVKAERVEEAREQALEREKEALEQNPKVEAVDYNYVVGPAVATEDAAAAPEATSVAAAAANDPYFSQGLQWGLQRIDAPQAWDHANGSGAVIALLDSGIDQTHPELAGKIDEQWDFENNDSVANDDMGHGTHVAGIAAASTNNGTGVAGTAPNARLQVAKVFGPGSTAPESVDEVISGIRWAAAAPAADVVNMSLQLGCTPIAALQNEINAAWNSGTMFVAAAGNFAMTNPNCAVWPAAAEHVIGVGSTTSVDSRSDYSSYGYWVDVAAPGGQQGNGCSSNDDILSTYPVGMGGYSYSCGTSMASPHVSGVAALLASQGLTNAQIEQRITATATDLGSAGRDNFFGAGLVDAECAVGGACGVPPTITSFSPPNGKKNVSPTVNVKVTFDKEMDASSLNQQTFQLFKGGFGSPVLSRVSCDSPCRTATLDPGKRLRAGARYEVRLLGGANGIKDKAGNLLADEGEYYYWTFKIRSS